MGLKMLLAVIFIPSALALSSVAYCPMDCVDMFNDTKTDLSSEIADLKKDYEERLSALEITNLELRAPCDGMIYDNKCFFVKAHSHHDITLPKARKLCAKHDLTLGNIYGKKHLKKIAKYVRSLMPDVAFVGLWTGMTKDESQKVLLSDGSKADYVSWFPGRPQDDSTASRINVRVWAGDYEGYNNSMYDHYPYWQDYGVLCEG